MNVCSIIIIAASVLRGIMIGFGVTHRFTKFYLP